MLPVTALPKTGSATAEMKISGGLWQNSGCELKLYLGCTGSAVIKEQPMVASV